MFDSVFLRLKREIANFLSKFIDSKIWTIKEETDRLEILHFHKNEDEIALIYNIVYLNDLYDTSPNKHSFIHHVYSSYIYRLSNTILEPTCGWIILDDFFVFKYSVPLIGDPWRPKPTMPSFIGYKLGRENHTYLDEGISIRYGWENYYHFLIDVLGQIDLLEKNGIPAHIPIVVPYYFESISFVQEFLKLSSFIKREIIVQKKQEYIHIKKIIVVKDTFISQGVFNVIKSVDHLRQLNRFNKIFIIRSIDHGRSIINNSEIIDIAKNYGFTSLDPSKISVKEQIEIFSGASQIVGIHGAGLTNIIFRFGLSLSLLEIFPDQSLTPEHYENLSINLKYNYSCILGEKIDQKNNFYLHPEKFESKLQIFFNYPSLN